MALHCLVVGEAILLHISCGLWFEEATGRGEVGASLVCLYEFLLFNMHLRQLVGVDSLEVQVRDLVKCVLIKVRLDCLYLLGLLVSVRSGQVLLRGRHHDVGLSHWLVGLDDALQVFWPRLKERLDRMHSSLWLVAPLASPTGLRFVLVSLGELLLVGSARFLEGCSQGRSQMYLSLLCQNVIASLSSLCGSLPGFTFHIPGLLLFRLVCRALAGVLLLLVRPVGWLHCLSLRCVLVVAQLVE